MATLGLSEAFVGLVIVAIAGNAVENVVGVQMALRNKPDLAITCINGGFNNLSHFEAAQVMAQIKPKAAIPCHYDMFPDNAADPLQFRASLRLRAQDVGYLQPEHGKAVVFER